MFSMDKKAKDTLLNDFDYERSKLLDGVWGVVRGSAAASLFAMIWAPARYFRMYSRIGRRPPLPLVIGRAVRRAVPGSIAIYCTLNLLTYGLDHFLLMNM